MGCGFYESLLSDVTGLQLAGLTGTVHSSFCSALLEAIMWMVYVEPAVSDGTSVRFDDPKPITPLNTSSTHSCGWITMPAGCWFSSP